MSPLKRWFNRTYPYYRVCLVKWCWRGQTYDHMCGKHNQEAFDREGM